MIFESPRLIARRFGEGDVAALAAIRNDPEVARYQSWSAFSAEDARRFITELAEAEPGEPGWFQFALEEKETGSLVGDCGLDVLAEDRRLARIGYTIAREHWNRGLASEAVRALAAHAFASLHLSRIEASFDPANGASRRVLEKAGFTRVGVFRDSAWFEGEWGDDPLYARVRGG
jgi:aminoglycoside 6'-N-acetyltransferase